MCIAINCEIILILICSFKKRTTKFMGSQDMPFLSAILLFVQMCYGFDSGILALQINKGNIVVIFRS